MYELDQCKDQVMTVFKLALVNLVLWVRQRYFPASYAQATWHRLEPFFRLPGRVSWRTGAVELELCLFPDRQLNREQAVLCAQVNATHAHLPDGRRLQLRLGSGAGLHKRKREPWLAHAGRGSSLTTSHILTRSSAVEL